MSDLFEISLRWQDGAKQMLVYLVIAGVILWVLSKIELPDKEEGKK